MKKIYSLLLTVLLLAISVIPVYAETSDIDTLSASATTTSVTVSGTTTSDIAAVMIQVLNDSESLAYYSLEVSSTKTFSGTISGLSLTAGSTYTVRAANYDGGDWKTITVTASAPPVVNDNSTTDTTDSTSTTTKDTSVDKTTTPTTKVVTLNNGDKKQSISTTEFIITKADGTILREITVKGNSDIKISADTKLIPTGSVMEQKELTKDSEDYKAVEKAIKDNPEFKLDEAKEVFAYDIDLSNANGTEIHELDGYVEVSLPVPDNITIDESQHLTVYRVNEDGSLTKCETEVKDGVITFKTDHFSTYIFALEDDETVATNVTTEQKTADIVDEATAIPTIYKFVIPLIVLCAVAFIAIVVAIIKNKKIK